VICVVFIRATKRAGNMFINIQLGNETYYSTVLGP
jgi:hypothetical protein